MHQAKISACALAQQPDGTVTIEQREFGAFKCDRKALAQWAPECGPEVVVMESTGIYCVAADVNLSLFAGEVADLFAGMDLRCCGHGPMTLGPACKP